MLAAGGGGFPAEGKERQHMASDAAGVLDEAYQRMHETAPEVFARAVAHGDEHAIKFADTAADVYDRTGDPAAIVAAVRAVDLIPLPE